MLGASSISLLTLSGVLSLVSVAMIFLNLSLIIQG